MSAQQEGERLLGKVFSARRVTAGTAFDGNCSLPGYDQWSSPHTLPGAYCQFYHQGNRQGDGACGVRIAERLLSQIQTGEFTVEELHTQVPDPNEYYPVETELKDVILAEFHPRNGGLSPSGCLHCQQGLTDAQAEKIVSHAMDEIANR